MRIAAPQYIRERRLADPGWVRRHRRSLGPNKQHRMCVRKRHELKERLAKLAALKDGNTLADRINARLSQFFGRAAQVFNHRAQAK